MTLATRAVATLTDGYDNFPLWSPRGDLIMFSRIDEGEEMRTEISAKFRREGVEQELAAAGLEVREWWTDPNRDFALSLSFPR